MRHIALAEPCVWMAAGLLSYKLCDRDFDCGHCALDAALRGAQGPAHQPAPGAPDGRRGRGFPADRQYAAGHTWIAGATDSHDVLARLGLDGFAAQLLPQPIRVVPRAERDLARGDVLCELELPEGMLAIHTPIAARVARDNPALHIRPALVVESPYDDGWLFELEPVSNGAPDEGLIDADRARERSDVHIRHFRRRIALHLLSTTTSAEPCMADGGEPLTSLSEILGGLQYLRLLREVLR